MPELSSTPFRWCRPYLSQNFVYKSSWLWNKFLETESGLDFSSSSCNSLKARLNQSLVNAQHRHSTDWHNDNFTEFGSMTLWILIIQHSILCMSVHDPVPVPVLFVSLSLSPITSRPASLIHCTRSRPILDLFPAPVPVLLVKSPDLLVDMYYHRTIE